MTVTGSQRSRLRLVVVQALVFSLFATLFVRLYYLQVIGGETYQAQAADQSVRDIVVHLIEEYARHCGHADLVRECIDGRTGQ